jgi:hypothetical protein
MDAVLMTALVLLFAAFATAHVAIAFGLTLRQPRWRGPVVLFVAPLAPYWGLKAGLRLRSWLWIGSLVGYAVALTLAHLL